MDAGSETARRGTPAAGKSHELRQAQDQSAACYVRHTHLHVEVWENVTESMFPYLYDGLSLQPSRHWAYGGRRGANRGGRDDVI